jgi:hypothetical protein
MESPAEFLVGVWRSFDRNEIRQDNDATGTPGTTVLRIEVPPAFGT